MTDEQHIENLKKLKSFHNGSYGADIDRAIKALEQTRWIPVSERLPESDEDVLVTNGIGMYVGWIDATDKGWRVDSESEYFMDDIVAWMPLPEPYEPQERSDKCSKCEYHINPDYTRCKECGAERSDKE